MLIRNFHVTTWFAALHDGVHQLSSKLPEDLVQSPIPTDSASVSPGRKEDRSKLKRATRADVPELLGWKKRHEHMPIAFRIQAGNDLPTIGEDSHGSDVKTVRVR